MHAGESRGDICFGRQFKFYFMLPEILSRTIQSLFDIVTIRKKCLGDLANTESAKCFQDERHLSIRSNFRMATNEHHPQLFIFNRMIMHQPV